MNVQKTRVRSISPIERSQRELGRVYCDRWSAGIIDKHLISMLSLTAVMSVTGEQNERLQVNKQKLAARARKTIFAW